MKKNKINTKKNGEYYLCKFMGIIFILLGIFFGFAFFGDFLTFDVPIAFFLLFPIAMYFFDLAEKKNKKIKKIE